MALRKSIEVVAAVIVREGRVLATQRGYGEQKGGWEFPGGKCEAGESLPEALEREIREELSCGISVGKLLQTVEYDYPAFHLRMHCFLCCLCSGEPILNEHQAARWLAPAELDSVAWLPADLAVLPAVKAAVEKGIMA